MENVPRKSRKWAKRLVQWARRQKDAGLLTRALIVAQAVRGRSAFEIAGSLACARSQVYRTVARFVEGGRTGLLDGRRANGERLVDENFLVVLGGLVEGSPQDHGYARPTWTRELLAVVAAKETGIRVHVCTVGRALRDLRARRGRPKPYVDCPLSERQKRRRVQKVRELIENCPPNEVVVYEDEADIHLNPKIGLDWMAHGQQKLVRTPGNNEKFYVAGALDAHSRELVWTESFSKNSKLFIALLEKLDTHYDNSITTIHVALDNYKIHKSKETRSALARLPRIRLHFLPPYSPDENKIERLWLDLHANVTRNHTHRELAPLRRDVARHLDAISPWIRGGRPLMLKAA